MADTKVSLLASASAFALTDILLLIQGSAGVKTTIGDLAAYASAPIFAVLGADYTLTSQTAAQKLFNVSANGAVTVAVGLYWMECAFQITGMSATSGNATFQLGGTAVLANPRQLTAYSLDATTQSAGLAGSVLAINGTTTTGALAVAGTGTALMAVVRGILAVTTAGTIIPQIALTTAAAAAVKAGSSFTLERMGAATDTSRGSWS